MPKKIFGDYEVTNNITQNGSNVVRDLNETTAVSGGDIPYEYYSKDYIDKLMRTIPISRVGSTDYLPMNINGSFEGATSLSHVYRMQPCLVENDGTMVYLRAGTNGSTYNFYYAYIKNIRNASLSQNSVVATNTTYNPNILGSTGKIKGFFPTNARELLMYNLTDESTNENYYVISLTNGTMNDSSHVGVKIGTSYFPNFNPKYAHIVGDKVFIWGLDSTITNSGWSYMLYTVPVSSIRNNSFSGLIRVISFSGQSLTGIDYQYQNTINIFDRWTSTVASDNPLFLVSGVLSNVEYQDLNSFNIQCCSNSDNTKIRVALYPTFRLNSQYGVSSMYYMAFSFVYDVSLKTITWDQTERAPILASATYDTSLVYNMNNQFNFPIERMMGSVVGLGNTGSVSQSDDGFLVGTTSRWSSSPQYYIQRGTINNTNIFDSLNVSTRNISSRIQMGVNATYGSAIGDNLIGPRFISSTKMLLACSGTYNNVSYGFDNIVSNVVGTDTSYPYSSVLGASYHGYAPNPNRAKVDNTNNRFNGLISLIDQSGNVSAYGSSFIEGMTKVSGGLLNPNTYIFANTYTMDSTVLTSIKQNIITNTGLTNITSSLITFFYVPDASYSKSIAAVMCHNSSTNQGYIIYAEVSATLSGTAITGGSIDSTRYNTYSSVLGLSTQAVILRQAGLTVSKFDGFNYIGIGALHAYSVPGNLNYYLMIGKIKSGSIQSQRYLGNAYVTGGTAYEHGTLPNKGFGVYNYSLTDYQTKVAFQIYGTTEAQLDALLAGNGVVQDTIIVASQEVPEGFVVYFTQSVPVFMNGKYYELPVQYIDLTSIDASPQNKTYYIYVSIDEGVPFYQISSELLTEELYRIYIGTIVTGDSNITSIVSEKVTRFLTYRPSTTARGSAIPASAGVPSNTGTRWQ